MQLATPVYTVRVPSFFTSWNTTTSQQLQYWVWWVVCCVSYIPQTVETQGELVLPGEFNQHLLNLYNDVVISLQINVIREELTCKKGTHGLAGIDSDR